MNGTEETERGRDGGWRCAGASRMGNGVVYSGKQYFRTSKKFMVWKK